MNKLTQIIKYPTRVNEKTKTLIDHIYINRPDLYAYCGVINPGASDHCLVYVS